MDLLNAIQFDNWAEFVDMGGYAFNVWAVYGLFVVFIAVNIIVPLQRRKTLLRDLRRRQNIDAQVALNRQSASVAGAVDNAVNDSLAEAAQVVGTGQNAQQGETS
ncbi:heme exporter protein CcmD [Gammaproteobacteria bacterium]|jgi:heme exporter protein D|nr:heme exporter protein CcmD [Gammaproteobacteria bacterium]MDB2374781.1 heme exporter protein CcmD [Gammaproteobacteria bacterium]MDC3229515.1 heme exporter protein CcmD [bacterium]